MRISQVLSFVLGVYCGRLLAEMCPPDWHRYGESCYFIITDRMDWHEANRTCAESRANLAVPNSQSEQDNIWELFLKDYLWIGCNDIEEEGNWQHCPMKGEINAYENWANGEPNAFNNLEDCGAEAEWSNGKWIDSHCRNHYYAVCKMPVCSGGRLTPQRLLHHAMEELLGECDGSCRQACRSHPRCHSFTLLE